MTSFAELQEENNELRNKLAELKGVAEVAKRATDKADYWKGQTKRTTAPTLRQGDVEQLAKNIIKDFSSTLNTGDIAGDMKTLGEYIMSGQDVTWEDVKSRSYDIARRVVENAKALVNGQDMAVYADVRDTLREKMTISVLDSHDIADWTEWRKAHFGIINISTSGNGTPVDVAYTELSTKYPWLFPADITAPSDQLMRMAEAIDDLTPVYENPNSIDMAEAVEWCSNAIVDGLMDEAVRQTPPTFADRQAARLDAQKAKDARKLQTLREQKNARIAELQKRGQVKTQEAVAKIRAKRDEQVAALKNHYKEIAEAKRGRVADSNARTRLLKIAKRLANKKLPAIQRGLINQYIGELDLISKGMTDKTLKDLTELEDWYREQAQTNPNFISDPIIEEKLARLHKKHISDMTVEEVADLTDILLNIENEIRQGNKAIQSKLKQDTYAMGTQVIHDIEGSRGVSEGVFGAIDKLFIANTLSPIREIRRLTGYMDSDPLYVLTQELADGQRKMFDYQRRAGEKFKAWLEDKDFVSQVAGKKAEEIKVSGSSSEGTTTVKITPAMRMSLYLHSLNDQNLRHIAGGGITVPDINLYKKGKVSEAYDRGVTIRLTPSEVRVITAGMTEKERAFARAAHTYYNGMSRDEINATSEMLKGYSLADVEDYFPIDTDKSFLKAEFDTIKKDGTIEGMGFLKDRINSSAPIMLYDLNTVLERSIQQHAKYVGLGIPVRNFNRVWNVTTGSYNEDGSHNNFEGSVQKAIKQKWGESGYRYVEKMMTDLQSGSRTAEDWDKLLHKVRSNYAGAVLTLNASVAMKQAASYPTAAAVVGFKPLVKALADTSKVNSALVAKYTPLLWYRSQGYSTQELGDMKKQGKTLPKALNWIQGMDIATTTKLWKAAEYYIRDTQKNLTRGSEDYYQAVAEVYNQIIEETQPNYTTMQRPQLLRSDSTLLQSLSMFKTQPFQNFNIVYDALGNLDAKAKQGKNSGTEETKKAYQEAKKKAVWATGSQFVQLAVFAGMTLAWNLFRGKTKNYEDKEDGLTIGSALRQVGRDMLGSAVSGIPFGSDLYELAGTLFLGERYYGFNEVTSSSLNDLASAFQKAGKSLGDIWNGYTSGEEIDWNDQRLKWDSVADAVSKVAGIPYENVVNLFYATFRYAAKAAQGQYKGEYAYLKLTANPHTYASDFYNLLYKAYRNDKAAYEELYADMVASSSFSEDNIKKAMEDRMKRAQGVESVADLESRYLSPNQQAKYDTQIEAVQGSKLWLETSPELQGRITDMIYALATDASDSRTKSVRDKIAGGADVGLDETEYLEILMALEQVDEPNKNGSYGTYTQDEAAAALELLDLTQEEKAYMWAAITKGKDENNPFK